MMLESFVHGCASKIHKHRVFGFHYTLLKPCTRVSRQWFADKLRSFCLPYFHFWHVFYFFPLFGCHKFVCYAKCCLLVFYENLVFPWVPGALMLKPQSDALGSDHVAQFTAWPLTFLKMWIKSFQMLLKCLKCSKDPWKCCFVSELVSFWQ